MRTRVTVTGVRPTLGMLLALVGLIVGATALDLWLASTNREAMPKSGGPWVLLLVVAVLLLTMTIHEAVHGLGFLVFGGRPRYRVGLAMGLPAIVVTCEGLVIEWWQLIVIGISPLALLTGVGAVLALSAPAATLAAILMITANAAGACGDLYVQLRVIACRVRWGPGSVTGTKDGFVYETAAAVTQEG